MDIKVTGATGKGKVGDLVDELDRAFWSDRQNRTAVKNAYMHYVKHKNEFPEINNAIEYVKATKSFTRNPPSGTLIKSDTDGFKYYYNE